MEAFQGRPLVLGHRGARREAPENTLPAFRRALEVGADGVELDARLTADGQVIVLHDANVGRTTDGRGRADQLPWSAIRRLDAGAHFGPAFAGTAVPTLAEALEVLAPARLVNVELKGLDGDGRLEARVLAIVREAGMRERVVFSSFFPAHLERLRRLDGEIALAWLYGAGPAGLWALRRARTLRLQALHPHRAAVSARSVRRARARDLRVVPWTVNDPAEVRRLLAWGVDGLITDDPAAVVQWLQG